MFGPKNKGKSINILNYLPNSLGEWGKIIQRETSASPEMIFYSLMGALSSAGSHLVNEKRYYQTGTSSVGPVNLSIIIIAGSGELKSAIKKLCFQPHYDFIIPKIPEYNKAIRRYHLTIGQKKTLTCDNGHFENIDAENLYEPVTPNFLQNNVTIEAVIKLFSKGMHSMTLLSDEGGTFVGSRAMARESHISTLATFNTIMSGDPLSKSTVKDGEILIFCKRLTFLMYMQPKVFDSFLEKCGNISDAGFFQRTIISRISSKKSIDEDMCEKAIQKIKDKKSGRDTKSDNILNTYEYNAYKSLITNLLSTNKIIDPTATLEIRVIEPSIGAIKTWLAFLQEQQEIIQENESSKDYDTINSFRERAPETASKIATLFQLADNDGKSERNVSEIHMKNAVKIVRAALHGQLKTYDVRDPFFEDVEDIDNWFKRKYKGRGGARKNLRNLLREVPARFRKKDKLLPILEHLYAETILDKDGPYYVYTGRELSK